MSETAVENTIRPVARSVAAPRVQPKMGANGRGDAVAAIKPRIAKLGYVRFLTLKDFDGRSRAALRVREIIGAIEVDLGGRDRLSEGQRQLVTRAAILSAQCEDFEARFLLGEPHELPDYLSTVNNLRRVLITLGLERRAKNVTPGVKEYLTEAAARHAAKEAVRGDLEESAA